MSRRTQATRDGSRSKQAPARLPARVPGRRGAKGRVVGVSARGRQEASRMVQESVDGMAEGMAQGGAGVQGMAQAASRKPASPHKGEPDEVSALRTGGLGVGTAPKLRPLIDELFILTKDGRIVRIGDVINYAQIDFIERCERQLETKGQIRIIVLKARQIGISTIIEAIAFVLSMLYDNFNSMIVSHESDSAGAILAMTQRYWQTYLFREFHEERYNGQTHLAWMHGSDINIATAKNVGAGRSKTIQFLHASEVAFWPKPDVLMTGLGQSIPSYGLTCVFLESTANGIGNYFHRQTTRAMKGLSEYEFAFYPWHEHPEYTAAYIPEDQRAAHKLTGSLDEEELRLRAMGVDDARLVWRRWAIVNKCDGDVEKFHQEYPASPHEAFVSTGRNVFLLPKLLEHYDPRRGKRGRLMRQRGRVTFVPDETGWLTIFAEPSSDRDWGVYLAGGDPTHTTAGDFACVQVLNRRTMEQVAVYRHKIDPINFGKHMQLIGEFYNNALLVPEKEGPGYATVGCIVGDNYPNVYATINVAKMQGKPTHDVYGWSTNSQTKHLAVSHLVKAINDPVVYIGDQSYGLIIHDETTLLELRDYVTTQDGGSYENSDGSEYDDGVMALAIAVTVHDIEVPPAAYEMVAPDRMPVATAPVRPGITSGTSLPTDSIPHDTPVLADNPADDEITEAPWEAWGREHEM